MAGVYISWPFCAQKCTYCNFASGVQPRGLEERYLHALVVELRELSAGAETLYLGGGTPSAMEPEAIGRVAAGLPREWREATLEAAPGSLSADRIRAWRRLGINRGSLGVQSFVRGDLARTGRRHDAATVEHDVTLLCLVGFLFFCVVLFAGL